MTDLRLLSLAVLILALVGGSQPCMAAETEAQSPLPLSAIFDLDGEPIPTPGTETSPDTTPASEVNQARARSPQTGTGSTKASGTPTPFATDPLCPPSAIPPLALLPTPTPVPTPTPTPFPLPFDMRREDLYAPPGQMIDRRRNSPFLDRQPGLNPDRTTDDAEIEIVNQWKTLYATLSFVPVLERTKANTDPELTARTLTLMYRPGQGDHFLLPSGRWQIRMRMWEPLPPYPEHFVEWPVQELNPRTRYTGVLTSEQERDIYPDIHSEVVDYRERRDPLLDLGRPPATPDATPRIGRIRNP